MAQDQTLAEVDAILSRQAIADLVGAYGRGVDRADPELLASIFHDDSVVVTGVVNGSGQRFAREITEFVSKNLDYCFHSVANHWVEINGDHAVGESYAIATVKAGGHDVITGGRYIDAYERRDGRWKIKSRVFVQDWARGQAVTDPGNAPFATGKWGKSDPVYAIKAA